MTAASIGSQSPALGLWWRELDAGTRTRLTFDPLWRSACAELNALEAEGARLPGLARRYRTEAAAILRRSLRRTA